MSTQDYVTAALNYKEAYDKQVKAALDECDKNAKIRVKMFRQFKKLSVEDQEYFVNFCKGYMEAKKNEY